MITDKLKHLIDEARRPVSASRSVEVKPAPVGRVMPRTEATKVLRAGLQRKRP